MTLLGRRWDAHYLEACPRELSRSLHVKPGLIVQRVNSAKPFYAAFDTISTALNDQLVGQRSPAS